MGHRSLIERALSTVSGLFWLLFALLLTPFREVRFGFVDPINIGHFLYSWIDVIRLRHQTRKRTLLLWEIFTPIANFTLLESFKRELHICASLFGVRSAHAFCRRFGWERYIFTKPGWNNIDPEGLLTIEEEPPSLAWHKSFMSSKAWLEDISQGRPIACVHVRDSAYTQLRQLRQLGDPQEQDFRNPPIETFVPAVRKLISSGYFVFRMGSLSHHSFPITSDFFFDYAKSHQKSDFLDIFIVAQCSFFMGTVSGFSDVPIIFGKRVLLTHCFPGMVRASYPKVTHLFVSLFSKRLERNLTNDEAAQLWHARHLESKDFQMLDLTIIYNTHEQILESVQALISQ